MRKLPQGALAPVLADSRPFVEITSIADQSCFTII